MPFCNGVSSLNLGRRKWRPFLMTSLGGFRSCSTAFDRRLRLDAGNLDGIEGADGAVEQCSRGARFKLVQRAAGQKASPRCALLAFAVSLIYCSDYRCSHSTTVSGDRWPDDGPAFPRRALFLLPGLRQPGHRSRANFRAFRTILINL